MVVQKNIQILFMVLAFFLFFVWIDFFFFLYKTPKCISIKESFDMNITSPNVILLSEILTDIHLDPESQIQKIQQISWNASESAQFNPILKSHNKIKYSEQVEHLKQVIMKNYILKSNNPNYNNMSKINDIRYLNSSNSGIIKCLNNKRNPSFQILEIDEILRENIYT
jgi:hypothetical protein